ncbi:unnamed protein product [Ixodes pacificus]
MELRVWLEGGPQRVVCGVTDATTCQDVVYALAQATAQTGRFALVERCRRSERALAPSERPLRLLARWGRYAGDVRFLLRRCGPTGSAATLGPAALARKWDSSGTLPATLRGAGVPPSQQEGGGRPSCPPPYDEAVTRLGQRFFQPSQPLLDKEGEEGGPHRKEAPPLQVVVPPALQGPGDSPSAKRKLDVPEDPQQHQYRELVRLVSLQRERLHGQQEELSRCDAELSLWEDSRAARAEAERLERALLRGQAELERLEHGSSDAGPASESASGGTAPLQEQARLCQQEERTLRSELTLARSQLANCETRLLQCQQRLCQLGHEVAEEQRRRLLLEQQIQQQQQQQNQLNNNNINNTVASRSADKATAEQLERELESLDSALEERRLVLDRLAQDLREANLQALSLADADHKHWLEAGGFYNRPGSTRKIVGSPRQLESAVPTNKNPNGVWV